MPFDPALALKLGHFVQDAYAFSHLAPAAQAAFVLQEPGYAIDTVLYANDAYDLQPPQYTVYGFVARALAAPGDVVVAIRGTESPIEWLDDAQFVHVDCPFGPPGAKTERGFTDLYRTLRTAPHDGATTAKAAVQALLAAAPAPLHVTGHSLGSAVATLLAGDLAQAAGLAPILYTFASPRIGDPAFATAFDKAVPNSYRIANRPDLVPQLAHEFMGYAHVNVLYSVDSTSRLGPGSIGAWHAMETYLQLL